MGLLLLFAPFILQTSAYKQINYNKFTYQLKSSSPSFYTNIYTFEELKPVDCAFHDYGRKSTPFDSLTIDDLEKFLPNDKDILEKYKKITNTLKEINAERNEISKKIGIYNIKKDCIYNDNDDTQDNKDELIDDEEYNKLKERAIELRKESYAIEKECYRVRSHINNLYHSIPYRKLDNVPKDYPRKLNEYNTRAYNDLSERNNDSNNPKHKLTHDQILEMFNYPWQRNNSRMLLSLGGGLSILEDALVRYLLWTNIHVFGFNPISVPYLTFKSALYSTGHLPKFKDNLFPIHFKDSDMLYLIPTGEVPLVSMLYKQNISPDQIPLKLVTYTQCFRNESVGRGSYSKGLIRQHQFGKVELVVVTNKESSSYWHSLLVSQVEFILRSLNIGYKTELLPIHDTPLSSAITVDVKGYLAAKNEYIELSSISNTLDYQSNMINAKIGSKNQCHILNASALPIGRLLACVLESHQCYSKDGVLRVEVPKVLRKFVNCGKFISPLDSEFL